MTFSNKDFVELELDLYANSKLVQTSNKDKAKEEGLDINAANPVKLVIGKGHLLQALDEDLLHAKENESRELNLAPEKAFGKRKKDLLRTFPKSSFTSQNLNVVVGGVYDFNGMYGTVKSIVGGRVMVDFNNPLSGKEVTIKYKVVKKIVEVQDQISLILTSILRLPENSFSIEVKEKEVVLKVPEQLLVLKDQLKKTLEEEVENLKDYSLKIENFKNDKK